jgi:hypothetical protein
MMTAMKMMSALLVGNISNLRYGDKAIPPAAL